MQGLLVENGVLVELGASALRTQPGLPKIA